MFYFNVFLFSLVINAKFLVCVTIFINGHFDNSDFFSQSDLGNEMQVACMYNNFIVLFVEINSFYGKV